MCMYAYVYSNVYVCMCEYILWTPENDKYSTWGLMGLNGAQWGSMGLNRAQWGSMGLNESKYHLETQRNISIY